MLCRVKSVYAQEDDMENVGNRIAAQRRVEEVANQPKFGLIRRALLVVGAVMVLLLAVAALSIVANPALGGGGGGRVVTMVLGVALALASGNLFHRACMGR